MVKVSTKDVSELLLSESAPNPANIVERIDPSVDVSERLFDPIYDSILGDLSTIKDEDLSNSLLGYEHIKCSGCASKFNRELVYDNSIVDILDFMSHPSNFQYTCKWLFGVNLLPFQLLILQALWTHKFPMFLASRGGSKSFILGIYSLLRCVFQQGSKIAVIGSGFRQSKIIFEYMETVWRQSPVFRNMCGQGKQEGPKRDVDRCSFYIGGSEAFALPIGDGTRIRGMRANYVLADEFAAMSREIFEVVIRGFASVSSSPDKRVATVARIALLKSIGMYSEAEDESESMGFGNQIVISGTADYSFNHFYAYHKQYHAIVESGGDKNKLEEVFLGAVPEGFDWRQYCIIRLPYELLPAGFMDESQNAQAQATMHTTLYNMEFRCIFAEDSNGFFKRSLIETCVCKDPLSLPSGMVQFTTTLTGNPNLKYVIGIDPASEHDNFTIFVLEVHSDHRRIVYGWSINRQKLRERLAKKGATSNQSFYNYCARKIRDVIRVFPSDHIGIDTQGGGYAIIEALHELENLEEGEHPMWPYIKQGDNDVYWWEEADKPTDGEVGVHNLHLVQFANAKFVVDANHGLRKDMETKTILFPKFDTVSIGLAFEQDRLIGREYDNLEDCTLEIEELKTELTTIQHTQTSTGRDHWDTPQSKTGGSKSKLRKDRYSALIIANMVARVAQQQLTAPVYKPVGGYVGQVGKKPAGDGRLYTGPEHIVSQMTGVYGVGVRRRR